MLKLRILKLAQSWTTMKVLLEVIFNSLGSLGYLSLIIFIIVYTFALVGKQLFKEYYTEDQFGERVPRWNFTDFGHSLMLIFRILCGEWIEPLYDTMRVTNPAAAIFYLLVLAIGNFLVRGSSWIALGCCRHWFLVSSCFENYCFNVRILVKFHWWMRCSGLWS